MRAAAFAILLLASGCREDRVFDSASELTLGAPRVWFPRTFLGTPSHALLEVRNGGRAKRTVRLSTEAPFDTERGPFDIPGGSGFPVQLTLAADSLGDFERPLSVLSEGTTLKATLSGVVEAIPECPARACWKSQFVVTTERCEETKAADGTSCADSSACLVGAPACVNGQCLGMARDCDDGDACTTDACDVVSGCVHFPATAKCGSSTNPCQVPVCDPKTGCGFVDAQDGTACGPSDCTTAAICLLGQCKTVPSSDGVACGDPSPCQPAGLCVAQSCVRPAPVELTPQWTAWVPAGRWLFFDSIGDRSGNVFWRDVAADDSTTNLVSVNDRGQPRFSVQISLAKPRDSRMALIDDLLIFRSGAKVEARRASNGTLAWSREFFVGLEQAQTISVRTIARGTPGTVYVGYNRLNQASTPVPLSSALAALSLSSGATQWETSFPGQRIDDVATPVDEAGFVYVGTFAVTDGKARYHSLTPSGQVRWNIANPHSSPAAVFGGRVYHWDHWLSETSTGSWVNAQAPTLAIAGYPRLALGAVSFVGTAAAEVPDCDTPGATRMGTTSQLVRVDPPTSTLRWSFDLASADAGGLSMTNTVLTSRSTVLFSQQESYCSKKHVLREVSAVGQLNFTCKLPDADYYGEGLLNGGRWIVAVTDPVTGLQGVRAFELDDVELPAHGWATAWGSPARDNHAR